jgi:hypothetical protein
MNLAAFVEVNPITKKWTVSLENTRSDRGPQGSIRYYYYIHFYQKLYDQRFWLTDVDTCTRQFSFRDELTPKGVEVFVY